MFILKKEATFTHPIVFYTPSDGGTQKEETFDAVFKIIPQSRINEIGVQAQKKQKELDEGIYDGVKISDYLIADEIFCGSKGSSGFGLPVITSQKAQALVQIFPIIKNVACFLLQHSVIFGQLAS